MKQNRKRANRRQFVFERLESRKLLTVETSAWDNGAGLTLSFVPDGTAIGSQSSDLFAKFSEFDQNAWQAKIVEGFQTWAQHSNLNIGVVSDDGSALGTRAPQHGDSRFGDIRVAAVPMSPEIWAISIPQDRLIAGSWAGDLLINSQGSFHNLDEIFSVATHEAGHILGLEHSSDPQSPMFFHGASTPLAPTAQDIVQLQALYGTTRFDSHEGTTGNETISRATDIKLEDSSEDGLPAYDGSVPLINYGDIGSVTDRDVFEIPILTAYTGDVTLSVQTKSLSQLTPKVTLYDRRSKIIVTHTESPIDGDLVRIAISRPLDERYYLQIESGTSGINAVGTYAVIISFDQKQQVNQQQIEHVVRQGNRLRSIDPDAIDKGDLRRMFVGAKLPILDDDHHTDDDEAKAQELEPTADQPQFRKYQLLGSLSDLSDIDTFAVTSLNLPTSTQQYLTVSIDSLDDGGLINRVEVIDPAGAPVPATVFANGEGQYVIQTGAILRNTEYRLVVTHRGLGNEFRVGNYDLVATFGLAPLTLDSLATGTLTAESPVQEFHYYVAESQLVSMLLRSSTSTAGSQGAIWSIIHDVDGNPLHMISGALGEPKSASSVLLEPGEYRIQVGAASSDGSNLPTIDFELLGKEISEPAGPPVVDPTKNPIYPCPPPKIGFCFPGGIVTTKPTVVVRAAVPILPTAAKTSFAPPADLWFWNTSVARTNVNFPVDVNKDGAVTALDAVVVINDLNTNGTHSVPPQPIPYALLDVSADKIISPLDAVMVINALNSPPSAEGEFLDSVFNKGLTDAGQPLLSRLSTSDSKLVDNVKSGRDASRAAEWVRKTTQDDDKPVSLRKLDDNRSQWAVEALDSIMAKLSRDPEDYLE